MKYLCRVVTPLVCLIISSSAYAQSGFYPANRWSLPSFEFPNMLPESSSTLTVNAGYTAGKFIGLKQSYGQIGVFYTPVWNLDFQPLVDVKLYRLSSSHSACSIGGGARWRDSSFCRIWGANLFYDYRQAELGNFSRIGLGLEMLGEAMDARLNLYLPIKSEKKIHSINPNFPDFIHRHMEFIYTGLDLELGTPLAEHDNLWLYGALGPYFYHHDDKKNVMGAAVRVKANWTQYVTLEARVSVDNVFKAHAQGELSFHYPLPFRFCSCEPELDDGFLTQPIYRNGVIFEKHKHKWDENEEFSQSR